jgi:hypothetical protein
MVATLLRDWHLAAPPIHTNLAGIHMTIQETGLHGWRKQLFSDQPTRRQLVADVLFGILLPIFCFVNDVGIFQDGVFGGSPSLSIRVWAYLAFSIGTFALVVWLLFARFLGITSSLVAGILLIGAVCAALIGMYILPFSLVGVVFVGIGLLGLTPFATAIIYFRNGRRALRVAQLNSRGHHRLVLLAAATAAVLAVGIPAIAQWLDDKWAGTFFWDTYRLLLRLLT